jgi:cytochrome c oxidase assembly protein subunit 15
MPPSPLVASQYRRAAALWLAACTLLVFAMVILGGLTRLTHSGLSITEWQPFVGTLPPLSAADWQAMFEKYQLTPEFRLQNHWMGVEDFKSIFWLEYFHRLLGRTIGLVFFVPLAWLLSRRAFSRAFGWRLAGIFLLGGLQGAVGWLMVQSGLVDNPRVSHLRLTIHLGLAVAIYAALLWAFLDVRRESRAPSSARTALAPAALAFAGLAFVTVLSGGLVAGIRAGFLYNTWPLMNGAFLPPDAWAMEPWWISAFENATTIQFNHRLLAYAVTAGALALAVAAWRTTKDRVVRGLAGALLAAVALQVTLGISTLLLKVPVPLAAAHQAGALLLLGVALALAHRLR